MMAEVYLALVGSRLVGMAVATEQVEVQERDSPVLGLEVTRLMAVEELAAYKEVVVPSVVAASVDSEPQRAQWMLKAQRERLVELGG